jgi:oligosaccharide reducing-end xylanase
MKINHLKSTFISFLAGCVFVVLSSTPLCAQIATGYEIAKWHQFKTAAISYTFDDNTAKQLTVAVPLFDKYNYKVTLNTVTGWTPNWTGLKAASINGHEIASHTVTHPALNTLSIAGQEIELQQSQSTINTNIPNAECVTIAYPNCVLGDLPTIKKYYIAGRICSGMIVSSSPSDFYNISSILVGTQSTLNTANDFNGKVALAKSSKGWCVFLIHGIDNDGGYSPTQSSEIGSHLSYVNTNSADYWVDTFGNVVKYIKERNALLLSETAVTTDSLQVNVSDNLDNTIYNVPVTVRRSLPASWQNARVYLNNNLVSSTISVSGTNKSIVFDVVPGQGELFLAKSNEVVLGYNVLKIFTPMHIGPNPFSETLKVETNGIYQYYVHSLDGRLIENGTFSNSLVIGDRLIPGTYFLNIRNEKEYYQTKIIKT